MLGLLLLHAVSAYDFAPKRREFYSTIPLPETPTELATSWTSGNLVYTSISVFLVLVAGLASGLTVGLLSIDTIQLKVLEEEGTPTEKRQAAVLRTLLKHHHLLLVTLLLTNALAMEALPIFLEKSVPQWAAVLLSVTAILLFGEIIPQAVCTGPWQLPIVMRLMPVVRLLMVLMYVVAYPISMLLDCLLGHHETHYARSHLKAILRLQREEVAVYNNNNDSSSNDSSALGSDEIVVIEGAMDLASKTVSEIMVPIKDVYMLEWFTPIDAKLRLELLEKGHSRVPVYQRDRNNVLGILLVKGLIGLNIGSNEPKPGGHPPTVGDYVTTSRPPIFCPPEQQLYGLLNEFQRGRHFAFVTSSPDYHTQRWLQEKVLAEQDKAHRGGTPYRDGCCYSVNHSPDRRSSLGENPEDNSPPLSGVKARSSVDPSSDFTSPWSPPWDTPFSPKFGTDSVSVDVNCGEEADPDKALLGIITLEDIIEELIQEEIYDEFDDQRAFSSKSIVPESELQKPSPIKSLAFMRASKGLFSSGVTGDLAEPLLNQHKRRIFPTRRCALTKSEARLLDGYASCRDGNPSQKAVCRRCYSSAEGQRVPYRKRVANRQQEATEAGQTTTEGLTITGGSIGTIT